MILCAFRSNGMEIWASIFSHFNCIQLMLSKTHGYFLVMNIRFTSIKFYFAGLKHINLYYKYFIKNHFEKHPYYRRRRKTSRTSR
jgi:hypothetical protein